MIPTLLASGGAGDCRIHLTDCATMSIVQSMAGHSGHVLSLCNWGSATFASGGADKSVRFWDILARGCVNMVQYGGNNGSPFRCAARKARCATQRMDVHTTVPTQEVPQHNNRLWL